MDSLGKIQLKNASHPAVDCSKMATQTNKIEVTMEEAEGANLEKNLLWREILSDRSEDSIERQTNPEFNCFQ